jgi:hypothetical protein
MDHTFIIQSGQWLGVGTMRFGMIPLKINFYMKWIVNSKEEGVIHAEQRIEAPEADKPPILNRYRFSDFQEKSFAVELENEDIGVVNGTGMIEENAITWQFSKRVPFEGSEGFEGFESYTLQPNGEYSLECEYQTEPLYRTFVSGRIWKSSLA